MTYRSIPDLSKLRVMFCRMEAVIRAERDLIAVGKLAPRTVTCVHLGIDSKRGGYYGYLKPQNSNKIQTKFKQMH